jgi:acyl carrier protein
MKTYCKEDIFNSTKSALNKYYNLINKEINHNTKNINLISLIGKNSKFDSLAFVTFIMILDKELKKIEFKKNLLFELQKKEFKNLTIKALINFINEIK